MVNNDDNLNVILAKLTEVKEQLISINQKTGALQRVEKMRSEILKFGWQGIIERYHPDVNTDDLAANELFQMYRFVYEDMKKRILVC